MYDLCSCPNLYSSTLCLVVLKVFPFILGLKFTIGPPSVFIYCSPMGRSSKWISSWRLTRGSNFFWKIVLTYWCDFILATIVRLRSYYTAIFSILICITKRNRIVHRWSFRAAYSKFKYRYSCQCYKNYSLVMNLYTIVSLLIVNSYVIV